MKEVAAFVLPFLLVPAAIVIAWAARDLPNRRKLQEYANYAVIIIGFLIMVCNFTILPLTRR